MKRLLFILFSITIICSGFTCETYPDTKPYLESHNNFSGDYAEMYSYQVKTINSLYKRYDELCDRILKNFKEDKTFISAFKEDIENFRKYRSSQDKLVHPRHPQEYGLMYYNIKWENDYTLTVIQIENIYKKIIAYCEFNEAFLNDASVCSKEKIESLFHGIKLY